MKMAVYNNLEIKTEINKSTKTLQEAKAKDFPHKALPPELFSEFVKWLTPEDAVNYAKSLTNRASQSEKGNLLAINLFKENLREVTDLTCVDFKRCKASYQDLTGKEIRNEDFLEFFKNLKVLSLNTELATSEMLTILENSPHLTALDLSWCSEIKDFSFLRELQSLTTLNLKYCRQIKDFSFLESLTNLRALDLSYCTQIKDFSFLGQLTNLESLNLGHCYQIEGFSFLERLPNLTTLNLARCNQIKDRSIFDVYPNIDIEWL